MVKEGLVGFFDILGYKKIAQSDNFELVAGVMKSILSLPTFSKKILLERFEGDVKERDIIEDFQKGIEYRVMSDSILLTIPFWPQKIEEKDALVRSYLWVAFLVHVIYLIRTSFDRGLPLRGSIALGKYILDETCFAGSAVIEAYDLATSLDFSGCVLTEECGKAFQKDFKDSGLPSQNLVFECNVPLKKRFERKLYVISWMSEQSRPIDLRQFILEKFNSHGKMLSVKDYRKLDHTEINIRQSFK